MPYRNGSTPTVLLVHGAFCDGSIRAGVIAELLDAGIGAQALANPLRSLARIVRRGGDLIRMNRAAHYGRSGLMVSARPGPGRPPRSPSSARRPR